MVSRVRDKELEGAIFVPKPSETPALPDSITVYTNKVNRDAFDENGHPLLNDGADEQAEDRQEACAKKVTKEGKVYYYVKRGNNGRFYNPVRNSEQTKTPLQRLKLPEWRYKAVNEKTFLFYLEFLSTGNEAWLINAEREAF